MQTFVVLGLIPGTNIQITFLMWQIVAGSLLLLSGLWLLHRAHVLRNWLVGLALLKLTRRQHSA